MVKLEVLSIQKNQDPSFLTAFNREISINLINMIICWFFTIILGIHLIIDNCDEI